MTATTRRAARHAPGRTWALIAMLLSGFVVTLPTLAQGLPPKAPGVIRIGVVMPRVQAPGTDAPQSAEAVRGILANYLQGPTIEVALLGARLPSQYLIEARDADCDFVLATTLVHRRGSQGGAAGNLLGGLTSHVPYGSSAADVARTAVVATVLQSAQNFAANVQARDDVQLGFRLDAIGGGKPLLDERLKRRARADGEDLLTPLVESAAERVGEAMTTRP